MSGTYDGGSEDGPMDGAVEGALDSAVDSPVGGSRDGDERTFAALAPARGRAFAQTWWGRAWLKALEDTALDGQQLKRGRRQAREGAVGAVSVRPGRITAVVQDRDGTAQRSDVLLQQLSEEEWDRFLDMAVDRAGHIAALLDREMPPHLVEDAAGAGVELLPGIGDLEPECGCEAWDHCPHSAALCYQMARLLDQDPFVLLLMRGRSERRLLDELQVRSVARAARTKEEPGGGTRDDDARGDEAAGVPAVAAFAARDLLPPLPAPPPLPPEPGQPPALDTEGAPPAGIEADALEFLAADAAARALRLLSEALLPGHEQQPEVPELTPGQDAVRLAATTSDRRLVARLASGSGRRPAELDLAVRAWRYGGAPALAVLEDTWTPEPEALARAAAVLDAAWEDGDRPRLRAGGGGRWTVAEASVQLRYGRDGRWWPYRKERGRWAPAGPGGPDPAAALADALAEDALAEE
ncbi:SWF or SNF family helicase [Streptomyces scopuliridis]|uniref:SWF or SNF family helicase n=1 Tax=Streptomyces scopuliridis TaxID=452529 RepID=A0ACD4ZVK6_9ACTN|nr:SWF or SNF family helicase [Streptomyces scopuliridis]WSB37996.1 SWF or SNF family helicase [Streptomyces scopuliridis]WSC02429.1 SWF or SNF family helicase [Streptomyces scopuliridis]WSC04037.1 SWF or SNF family helicase [Streptomyces scopuliridis]